MTAETCLTSLCPASHEDQWTTDGNRRLSQPQVPGPPLLQEQDRRPSQGLQGGQGGSQEV